MSRPAVVIDPALFAPEAVSADTRAFNDAMRERFSGPGIEEIGVEAMRAGALIPRAPRTPRGIDREIPGPGGAPLGLRVIL